MNSITIKRSHRRSLAVHIYPDLRVVVSAPKFLTESQIQRFIDEKREWIDRKLKHFAKLPPQRKKREFITGEHYPILGEDFALKIATSQQSQIQLGLQGILIAAPTLKKAKSIFHEWYLNKATQVIQQRVTYYAQQLDVQPRSVTVKDYKGRWGSCKITGDISFNWRLIMAPLDVLDYVVVHELCHMKEHNHSKRYWAHVEKAYPNYKLAKKWLREAEQRKELEF